MTVGRLAGYPDALRDPTDHTAGHGGRSVVSRSGSPIEVRDCEAYDDAALDGLMAGWIGRLGAAFVRDRILGPDIRTVRLVARCPDGIAAYGHVFAAPLVRGGRAPVTLFVHVDRRREGIGSLLWNRLLEQARSAGVSGVMTLVDHKDTKSLAAAAGRGLVDDGLHLDSALDLGGPLQQGAIVTRPIPVEHEAGRAYVHDLVVELGHDAPDIGPDQEMVPRSAFDRMIREPWQGLLLLDGDDVAGITLAFPREEPGEANTAFTGVRRAWRGRGLSAPLKAAHARVLRDRGFRVLRTQTMEHNAAILRANARLGFRVTGGYRDLVHDF